MTTSPMDPTEPASTRDQGEPIPRRAALPRRRTAVIAGAASLALIITGGGVAYGATLSAVTVEKTTATVQPDAGLPPAGSFTTTGTASLEISDATDEQQLGVVTILTTLYYEEDAEAAGTGMILTSDGEILTNYHVIEGATSIEVTVESTGEVYEATVVGSDASADIAVLQLSGAAGLDTVEVDDDGGAAIGDIVTSVGNAEGTGDLVSATGEVLATDETITVASELTGEAKTIVDLIEFDADVVSGDSGGPLVDAEGEVVGIVTAASSGTREIAGYAIDIETAMAIVDLIDDGTDTDAIQLGTAAFLGVVLGQSRTGAGTATIASTVEGLPASLAGLAGGDTITAVDGAAVSTSDDLSALIASHSPGDTVVIDYLAADGTTGSVAVTLVAGPA